MFTNFCKSSEIEAKICFQFNAKKKHISNVSIHEFQGVKYDLLQEFDSVDYYELVTIYDNGIRKIERGDSNDSNGSNGTWFEKKTRVNQFIKPTSIPFLFIKWTHALEEKVDEVDSNTAGCVVIRRKNVCKIQYNKDWDIYLTMVNGYNCEIEIEYTCKNKPPTDQDVQQVNNLIVKLFNHRFEFKIIKQFNMLVCGKPIPHLNWCVNKPVNLKFDMWTKMSNNYGFYLKMDGIRYLLYSSGGKLYAINETSRIMVYENTRIPHNTILDAEYINDTFHIFDVLYFNDNDLRDKGMYFRNVVLKNIPYDLNMEYTEISTDYNLIWHYVICGLPEYTDGIVFFPLDEPYKNKLTYKYKPSDLLTIDFLVKQDGLYVVDDDGMLIVFKGNQIYPYVFNEIGSGSGSESNSEWKIDSIVEFQYKDGKFIPIRVRHDKIKPNYIGVALDIWEDINNPIDLTSFVQNILSCR